MFVNEEVCETVFIILTKKLTTKLTTALTMSSLQLFLLSGQSGDAKCLLLPWDVCMKACQRLEKTWYCMVFTRDK